MKKTLKVLFWLVLVAAFFYCAYYAYSNWWDNEEAEKIKGEVKGISAEAILEDTKNFAGNTAEKTKQTIGGFVKDKLASAISFVGEEISYLGDSISTNQTKNDQDKNYLSISDISGGTTSSISISSDSGFIVPSPSLTLITKINVPLLFSLNNEMSYEVSWGDGQTETGGVIKGESKLLSHSWKQKGDYSANFKISKSDKTDVFTFSVRVYE